ncbi:hypothetical protein JQU52_06935 [Paralysiella testudinis]|uniref:Transposase n=2 Tax=Paralysiella testudinis TaxID=2809020 RepID=A0A892ZEZ7_9NEIS|nr:hypothetical protein JQU52_09035 [Paralysiella testudinis]QRQ81522.1 hypothetical protein JQU52_12595 [Paralysiella testudinis]QRQ81870.1 hypothetical protein JQU52_14620 [Paralysiella testudinis]QRQ82040.1 hypothetical protein JQU52_00905 [Paralysiella testudinis]QRQ83086.1 hypothetical protein JQU52_06935 [Paralysiella testudinis]
MVSLRMVALYHSKHFTSASQMAAYLGLVPKNGNPANTKAKPCFPSGAVRSYELSCIWLRWLQKRGIRILTRITAD